MQQNQTPQMSCNHDQLMELIRLRNAINSRKEECNELENKISSILSQKTDGVSLSDKLQRLEQLQLKRIELQNKKQALIRQNNDLKMHIENESLKLMKNVEEMEKVQKTQMKQVLEKSVQVMEISEEFEKQHQELEVKVKNLKKELITQLQKIYSLKKKPNDQYSQPIFMLNGITIPNKVNPSDMDLMNEIYGDIAHIVNLLAKYFEISLKYPLYPNAMFSMISARDSKQPPMPLYGKSVKDTKTALSYLNYDIDQLLIFFGPDKWADSAHEEIVEKVFSIYKCCDDYFEDSTL